MIDENTLLKITKVYSQHFEDILKANTPIVNDKGGVNVDVIFIFAFLVLRIIISVMERRREKRN